MKTIYKAKVDGKEIPVDIVGEGDAVEYSERKVNPSFTILPLVVGGLVLLAVAFISIGLFIWLLPVLVPIALVLLVVRMIRSA